MTLPWCICVSCLAQWHCIPCKIHTPATAVQLPGIPRATAGESWNATACNERLHVIVPAIHMTRFFPPRGLRGVRIFDTVTWCRTVSSRFGDVLYDVDITLITLITCMTHFPAPSNATKARIFSIRSGSAPGALRPCKPSEGQHSTLIGPSSDHMIIT